MEQVVAGSNPAGHPAIVMQEYLSRLGLKLKIHLSPQTSRFIGFILILTLVLFQTFLGLINNPHFVPYNPETHLKFYRRIGIMSLIISEIAAGLSATILTLLNLIYLAIKFKPAFKFELIPMIWWSVWIIGMLIIFAKMVLTPI